MCVFINRESCNLLVGSCNSNFFPQIASEKVNSLTNVWMEFPDLSDTIIYNKMFLKPWPNFLNTRFAVNCYR